MSEFYTVYVILQVIILDQDKFKHQGQGSDVIVTFGQLHCVQILLTFS